MAAKKKTTLPQRFAPYAAQAATETAIRYGGQEDALKSIFGQTTANYQRQAQAQDAANRSLLGALQTAGVDLNRVYSDAGLTPEARAAMAGTPTGARLAGELARAQGGIQQQQLGAQAGQAYQVQHLGDLYREDVGKINDQASSLAKERGLYESSLLDQLIGTDRSTRHDANQHVKDQQFTADQNLLDNAQSQTNATIGAGIDPSTGQPLPGHGPKPKPKPKATPGEQATASTDFSLAAGNAEAMAKAGIGPDAIVKSLTKGRKAVQGKPVYEEIQQKDSTGKVIGTKRQPKLNADGTVVTTGDKDPVDPVNPAIAQAAAEMATKGYVSPATVKELHRLGYQVRGLPGIKTTFDRPKPAPYTLPNRQGTAPSRNQQPG